MKITGKGNQKNKGDRGTPRAHDSPGGRDTFEGLKGKPGEIECIEVWLENVKFKKATFGGVSETDVWKKIVELNEMYETALTAERARYNMLLKANAERSGKPAPRRAQVRRQQTASERTGDIYGNAYGDVYKDARNVPASVRSRDAPAEELQPRAGRTERDGQAAGAAERPRKRIIEEETTSGARQQVGPAEEKSVPKSVQKSSPPRRKSAKPSGAPYIRTDWLDDEDEETIFDLESKQSKN